MKLILTLFLSISLLSGFCQTQKDLDYSAHEANILANIELNDVYQKILLEYKSDTLFIKNLKASQRIWITFRDAEVLVKYPEIESSNYGSVLPMCVSLYLEHLTRTRITTLKEWTTGAIEGDVCNGSVKIK
jgi:uncharacterized protein YecT (DUF1311 family)